jgi:hypothetical protein
VNTALCSLLHKALLNRTRKLWHQAIAKIEVLVFFLLIFFVAFVFVVVVVGDDDDVIVAVFV